MRMLKAAALMLVSLLGLLAMTNCGDDPPQQTKTRVPTMQQQADDAKLAAQQAQEAAKAAQDALAKLQESQKQADGPKLEHTAFGKVTDVTEIWEAKANTPYGEAYIAFTFVEDAGFSKRFYPVCSEQTIPAGKDVSLNFHWLEDDNSGHHNHSGCYIIDGYTAR